MSKEHFEPVTARTIAEIIVRNAYIGYMAGTNERAIVDSVEGILASHLRKPSDEDKSVPQRCEEAYDEAVKLIEGFAGEFTHDDFMNLRKAADKFLQKPNPFKEADIVKDVEYESEREQKAVELLEDLRQHFDVDDKGNLSAIDLSEDGGTYSIFNRIHKFLIGDNPIENLSTFSLEAAKNGAKVVTRDGREAKVVAEGIDGETPILVVVTNEDGTKHAYTVSKEGCLLPHSKTENKADLFILKEPETIEMRIFKHKTYGTIDVITQDECFMDPTRWELIKTITVTI